MKNVAKDFTYTDAIELMRKCIPARKPTVAEVISRLFRDALKWKD